MYYLQMEVSAMHALRPGTHYAPYQCTVLGTVCFWQPFG